MSFVMVVGGSTAAAAAVLATAMVRWTRGFPPDDASLRQQVSH